MDAGVTVGEGASGTDGLPSAVVAPLATVAVIRWPTTVSGVASIAVVPIFWMAARGIVKSSQGHALADSRLSCFSGSSAVQAEPLTSSLTLGPASNTAECHSFSCCTGDGGNCCWASGRPLGVTPGVLVAIVDVEASASIEMVGRRPPLREAVSLAVASSAVFPGSASITSSERTP